MDTHNLMENGQEWEKTTKEALVSNKNVVLYYYFLKNYCEKNNHPIDLSDDLFDDKYEKGFFLNKDNWCTLEEYVRLVEKAISLTDNHELPKIVGSMLTNYRKELKLQEFWDATFSQIRAFFLGPVEIFRQVSLFNQLFNQTKDMKFIHGENGKCLIFHKFKDQVDPVYDYVSEMFIEGIFMSVIDLFNLKKGVVNTYLKQYDLKRLLEKKFFPQCRIEIKEDVFYLNNDPIAERTEIVHASFSGHGSFSFFGGGFHNSKTSYGWRITRDVYYKDAYLVLKKNDIYNAPYFATEISWEKISPLQGMSSLLGANFVEFSPLKKSYARLMQSRILEEQEKTRLIMEKKNLEKEVGQLLERIYINHRFIEKAKKGPIPFRSISATNIFMDLHNSTELRKRIGDEAYRSGMNNMLRLIKKNLLLCGGGWAWLNKVLGDGCYIVFGTYNYFKQENDQKHIAQAIEFSRKMLDDLAALADEGDLGRVSANPMHDFQLRFALESGEVEMGEAHENDFEGDANEIDFQSLRVFDADGRSVHLAKRIEETSKQIITKGRFEKKSGIFLGPKITAEMESMGGYSFERIRLADLGISISDFGEIEHIAMLK